MRPENQTRWSNKGFINLIIQQNPGLANNDDILDLQYATHIEGGEMAFGTQKIDDLEAISRPTGFLIPGETSPVIAGTNNETIGTVVIPTTGLIVHNDESVFSTW